MLAEFSYCLRNEKVFQADITSLMTIINLALHIYTRIINKFPDFFSYGDFYW